MNQSNISFPLSILFLLSSSLLLSQIEITFSRERGFYNSPFELELTTNVPEAVIYYSTDGSIPNGIGSTVYRNPISINQTLSIKAIAITNTDTSELITYSYINMDKLLAAPYLDKEIVQSKNYSKRINESFRSLPLILLNSSANEKDVIAEDVASSTEIIWPDNSRPSIHINNGLQTWGASPSNPKKNYRLEFRAAYGPKRLKADLFSPDNYDSTNYPIEPNKSFKNLLLRAGSQDALNAEFSNEALAQYVRNRVNYDIQMEMGYPVPHGRFVHLFFNNAYLGQYHLVERVDAPFLEDYYGGKESKYEVYKSNKILNGPNLIVEESEWYTLGDHVDFSSEEAMIQTNRKINLKSAADYLLLMAYSSGHDWGEGSNCLAFTNTKSKKKGYQFLIHDTDFSYGNGGSWHPDYSGQIDYFNAPLKEDGPVPDQLMKELEFRILLMDQMQLHCYNDGLLTSKKVETAYMHRIRQVEKSLIAESARWGSYKYEFADFHVPVELWDVDDEFKKELKRVTSKVIPKRTEELIKYFKENDLASELDAAQIKVNEKKNKPVTLQLKNKNKIGLIYYTTDGSDPRLFGGALSTTATLYKSPIELSSGVLIKTRIYDPTQNDQSIDKWSPINTITH